MRISTVLRCSSFALFLAPLACTFPVKAGDNPGDPSGDDPSDEPTGSPGFCGDGVVDGGEACDDGNDADDDACDAACQPTGAVEWTFRTKSPWTSNAVAVGPTGRIVVVGDGEVLALDPDGQQLWLKLMPEDSHAFTTVKIDEQGTIYLAGEVGTMHALAPNGDELWRSDVGVDFEALVLADGALHSLDTIPGGAFDTFIVRRHDRSTGAVEWAAPAPAGVPATANTMAIADSKVVVVGFGFSLVGDLDDAAAIEWLEFGEQQSRIWESVAATADGGLAIAGQASSNLVIARVGADLSTQWAHDDEQGDARAIARGSQGALAVVGRNDAGSFVRRLDASGATVWTKIVGDDGHDDIVTSVEFGPGFLIALGIENFPEGPTGVWVRRIAD